MWIHTHPQAFVGQSASVVPDLQNGQLGRQVRDLCTQTAFSQKSGVGIGVRAYVRCGSQ